MPADSESRLIKIRIVFVTVARHHMEIGSNGTDTGRMRKHYNEAQRATREAATSPDDLAINPWDHI